MQQVGLALFSAQSSAWQSVAANAPLKKRSLKKAGMAALTHVVLLNLCLQYRHESDRADTQHLLCLDGGSADLDPRR